MFLLLRNTRRWRINFETQNNSLSRLVAVRNATISDYIAPFSLLVYVTTSLFEPEEILQSFKLSDDHHVILLVPTICRLALLEVYIYLQRFRDFSFLRQF